jgi:hypothetical protein
MQKEMTALTRKRIAGLAVDRLAFRGLLDSRTVSYSNVALAIVRELGMPIPSEDDMAAVVGRMGDLIALRLEAACN